ncbi:LADA_0G12134g1_1 [Lachancea dasiensis]|uniref:LADA_0G12134g1_1 n=1 Tax=Lachancea dasiensis TaxID=1072105 RepID=A0A1G4JVB7_9SACH|nr:LADA_0G12134g1_1 [Lachancea dasiensis]
MASAQSTAFQRVRPCCIELSRQTFLPKQSFDPNSAQLLNGLRALERELAELDDGVLQLSPKFADYVFVPIASLLKQDSLGVSQTEALLLVIGHLLSLCWSSVGALPLVLAQQLFPLLTFLVSTDTKNVELLKKPPHFQLAGCVVFAKLFNALAVQKRHSYFDYFCDPKSLPSLGHSVTILLDILNQNETEPDLQLASVRALHILYRELLTDGEIVSFILPGHVSTFSKLLVRPGISVKSSVVCATMELFGDILALVYRDSDLHIAETPVSGLQHLIAHSLNEEGRAPARIEESLSSSKKMHRDSKWLKATTSQVKIALEAVLPKLVKRKNASINLAIRDFLATVMDAANGSLANCRELFLSTMLSIRISLPHLLQSQENSRTLKHLLINQISQLPHTLLFEVHEDLERFKFALSITEDKKLSDIQVVGKAVTELQRALAETLEQKNIRFNGTKVVEQSTLVIIDDNFFDHSDANYRLLSAISASFEETLSSFLCTAGVYCGLSHTEQLVATLLSSNQDDSNYSYVTSIWISSLLISSSMASKKEQTTGSIESYLTFGDQELDLTTSAPSDACYMLIESSLEILNDEANNLKTLDRVSESRTIISLESIRLVGKAMGEAFREELIDTIFPILDCLASPSPAIRHFAQLTTLSIAQSLYGGSVHDLIWDNMDYLVDSISIRLTNCMTQRMPTLLMVICRIGGYESIKGFKDVLETIFRLLDFYHGYDELCAEFFQLFDIVVTEMRKTYLRLEPDYLALSDNHTVPGGFVPWGMRNMNQVVQLMGEKKNDILAEDLSELESEKFGGKDFGEFLNRKLEEVDSDDEDEDTSELDADDQTFAEHAHPAEDSSEKWSSPIPKESYRLLLQIIGYGDRLLTHRSRPLKVQILRLMSKIFPMLATEYDMLLPQVARSWDILVVISLSSDFAVVKPALECLQMIIRHSGDFITKRFLDLWENYQTNSVLLRHVATKRSVTLLDTMNTSLSASKRFPSTISEALGALSEMLLEGISKAELFIPEDQLQEMVYYCLLSSSAPKIESRSLHLGDVLTCLLLRDEGMTLQVPRKQSE